MLIQNMPNAAIKFFVKVFPYMETRELCSTSEMAQHYGCTPQAASRHVQLLERTQFFHRVHYRAWELNLGKIDELLNKGET